MIRDSFIAFDEYVCEPDPTVVGGGAHAYSSEAFAARLGYYDKLVLHAVVDTTPAGTGTATLTVTVEHSANGIAWVVREVVIDGTVHRNSTDSFLGYIHDPPVTPLTFYVPLLPLVRLHVQISGSFAQAHVRMYANVRDPSD